MAKLSMEIIKKLYAYGKAVHNGEIQLDEATKKVVSMYPESIAKASASFYINLYSEYLSGKGSTWNQNSSLVLYYVENIIEELDVASGKMAFQAGMKFARAKSKKVLIKDLNDLWVRKLPGEPVPVLPDLFENEFENWLKSNKDKQYTDNTVRRYIRALKKAEEWLGIKLSDQVLNICDLTSFEKVEDEIKNAENYAAVNQDHGHGDLSAALSLYKVFIKQTYLSSPKSESDEDEDDNNWWPALNEYNPGFSKEDWLEILRDPEIIGPIWGGALAMFYAQGGEATCSQLGEIYGRTPFGISGNCTQLAMCIHKKTNCSLYVQDGKEKYWPILFVGRDASSDEKGNFVWKLRDELYDAIAESDIMKYLPSKADEPEETMNISAKDAVNHIKSYIASQGFTYNDGLIENFYLSLKSKPFVILAGTSGTGKTRLVKLFAEAINAEYKMVPVRPDWSDSSDLFGHVNLSDRYVPGAILEFIAEASSNPEKPYILCLDEMNLARVEYYLSDFLSVIETRDFKDGRIISDPLVSLEKYGVDTAAAEKYGELRFPQNLYLVGTVNMDETTFPFSKKVLDRANTIEFNYVDLTAEISEESEVKPLRLSNDFLETKYLLYAQCKEDKAYVDEISKKLQKLNEILGRANAHVGYRVRDEIVFYMLNNKESGLLSEDEAFDNEIMQKILPRIQGSSSDVKDMLCELFKEFAGDYSGFQTNSNNTSEKMEKKIVQDGAKYLKSANKVKFMVGRFEDDGFTSYWL